MDPIIISPESPYRQLHNDFPFHIDIDDEVYASVTHYVYAMMASEPSAVQTIKDQPDAATARKIGNGILFGAKKGDERKIARNHDFVIIRALERAYRARFTNNKLGAKLLGTGIEPLVYKRGKTTFVEGDQTMLGLNTSDNGQNRLGRLLERIRGDINVIASLPSKEVHEIDRLFFADKRRELLLSELYRGHFPPDYSLGALYSRLKGIEGNIDSMFLVDYPGDVRISRMNLYQAGKIDPVVAHEFQTGDTDWIETAYDHHVEDLAILDAFLENQGIAYETMVLSLAKQKILDGYWRNRFVVEGSISRRIGISEFNKLPPADRKILNDCWGKRVRVGKKSGSQQVTLTDYLKLPLHNQKVLDDYWGKKFIDADGGSRPMDFHEYGKLSPDKQKVFDDFWGKRFVVEGGSSRQIDFPEYLERNKITTAMIMYIGEDAISPFRHIIAQRYRDGEFLSLGDRIVEKIRHWRFIVYQSIIFSKYTPKIDNLPAQFMQLVEDEHPEPLSPRETYSGEKLDLLYKALLPEGACSDDATTMCPLGPDSDEESGGDESDDERREDDDGESEPKAVNVGEGVDLENYQGDDEDDGKPIIPKAVRTNMNYTMPLNPIIFGSKLDYPYEWLAPDYIDLFSVDGLWYPSVLHYVAAKLATPPQFRNVSIRLWIQKDPKKIPAPGYDRDTTINDFKTADQVINDLDQKIKDVYLELFKRYAKRAINIKMKHFPFRQRLFATKPRDLIYYDAGTTAFAGTPLVDILKEVRKGIKEVDTIIPIKCPEYDKKKNLAIYTYIKKRLTELLKAVVLFSRYRLSTHDGYPNDSAPVILLDDCRFVLTHLYSSCSDINYNEVIENPPSLFEADFQIILDRLLQNFFPGRTLIPAKNIDAQDAIQKLRKGGEENLDDKIFIAAQPIMSMIWTHITAVTIYLEEDLDAEYSQIQINQRILDARKSLRELQFGTKTETIIIAITNILISLHLFFNAQSSISDVEVQFLYDFIFPYPNDDLTPITESESYNRYTTLISRVTEIYGGEQKLSAIKKLAWIIDRFRDLPKGSDLYNKTVTRVKFFAFI